MKYNKIFAFIREQKAFTAFMMTLVVISSFGALFAARGVNAETVLLNVTDTLFTAASNRETLHTFKFTPVNPLSGDGSTVSLDIAMHTDFSIPALTFSDVKLSASGTTYTAKAACDAAAGSYTFAVTGDSLQFTLCSNSSIATTTPLIVEVGTGATKMTNPSVVGSYDILISLNNDQSQKIRVAIVDNVLMTASVDPRLTFSVNGTSSGTTVNGTTTNVATTASTIDYGIIPIDTAKVAAQDLTISTNARNGFNVTVQTDSEFKSANGATIDAFRYEGASSTPAAWAAPASILNNDRTWGQIGITTSDLTNTIPSIAADQWVGNFIENPVTVFSQASSTRNQTATVGFQVQISDLQEAATDYQTNVIYVATPVF